MPVNQAKWNRSRGLALSTLRACGIHVRSARSVREQILLLTQCWYVGAVVLLSGCGRSVPNHPTATAPPVKVQHVLRRGNGPEPDSLDPQKARTAEAQVILRDVFECLTSLDHEGHAAPGGADSWSISPDGRTYSFTLRPSAHWSNGDPVTGGDYVAGLRRLVDPTTASENADLIEMIHNARAIVTGKVVSDQLGVSSPDPLTLIVQVDHPAGYLLSVLSHPATCPTHQSAAGIQHETRESWRTLSNGPFTIDQWVPGESVSVVRNPYYWNNAGTFWDKVIYVHVADANAEFLRYRAGELDITRTIPRSDYAMIQADIPNELHVAPALGVYYYGFNLNRPLFRDNPKLRLALTLAIDREQLAQSVLRTGEVPSYGWVPPTVDHHHSPPPSSVSLLPREQQLTLARQLMTEAGYSPSRPLQFALKYNTGEIDAKLAISVAAMWKQDLGVDVQIVGEEFRALLSDIDSGDVMMFRSSWAGDYNDPLAFLEILRSDSGMNLVHYRNPHFDKLLDQASLETDPDRRAQFLGTAEEVAIADLPAIPLYFLASKHLVKPNIVGWYENPLDVVYSKDLSVKDEFN